MPYRGIWTYFSFFKSFTSHLRGCFSSDSPVASGGLQPCVSIDPTQLLMSHVSSEFHSRQGHTGVVDPPVQHVGCQGYNWTQLTPTTHKIAR